MQGQCLLCCHHDSEAFRDHAMNAEQCQMAADFWTKPTDLSLGRECRRLRNYIHERPLLLLSPNADTHFTIPQRAKG